MPQRAQSGAPNGHGDVAIDNTAGAVHNGPSAVAAGRDTPVRRDILTRFRPGNEIGKATQFKPQNDARLTHGRYSDRTKAAMLEAMQEAASEIADDITRRQGFACTPVQRNEIRRYVELVALANHLFETLMDGGGPTTQTGKIKRTFQHYLAVTTSEGRIAAQLGMPKPPRDLLPNVPPVGRDQYRPDDEGAA